MCIHLHVSQSAADKERSIGLADCCPKLENQQLPTTAGPSSLDEKNYHLWKLHMSSREYTSSHKDVSSLFQTSSSIGHRIIPAPPTVQGSTGIKGSRPRTRCVPPKECFPGTDIPVASHFATTHKTTLRKPHTPSDNYRQRACASYSVTDTFRKAPEVGKVQRQKQQQEYVTDRALHLRHFPVDRSNVDGSFVRQEKQAFETESRSQYRPRHWTQRHVREHNRNVREYAAESALFEQVL